LKRLFMRGLALASAALIGCSDDPKKPEFVNPSQFEGRFSGNTVVSNDFCNCNAMPDTFDYVVDIDGETFILRSIDGKVYASGAWFQSSLSGTAATWVNERCNDCRGLRTIRCVFNRSNPNVLSGSVRHLQSGDDTDCTQCQIDWTLSAKRP
jgi:hypothetical protein